MKKGTGDAGSVQIPSGSEILDDELNIPAGANGIVLFAHRSGSRSTQIAEK